MDTETLAERIRVLADANPGFDKRVLFDLGGDGVILLDAASRPPAVSREAGEADATIRVTADNLGRLVEGDMDPTLAYMTGKLKVDGSMGIAIQLGELLSG